MALGTARTASGSRFPHRERPMPALLVTRAGRRPRARRGLLQRPRQLKELLYWSRLPAGAGGRGISTLCVDQPGTGEALRLQACRRRTQEAGRAAVRRLARAAAGRRSDAHRHDRHLARRPLRAARRGLSSRASPAARCGAPTTTGREVQQSALNREGENPVPHYWAHVFWAFGAKDMDDFLASRRA